MRPMRWWVVLTVGAAVLAGGCMQPASSGSLRVEELEKSLKRERELRETKEKEVAGLREERGKLLLELEAARRQAQGAGGESGAFEFVPATVRVGWLTASVDWDDAGGDDGVQALVVIEDQTGNPIKRAGAFRLELFDLERDKDHAIETWTFTAEAASGYWMNLASGYLFKLSYVNGTPTGKEVVLVVKARLSEGGEFKAMRTLRVHH